MKAAGVDVDDLMSEVASIKLEIPELEHEETNLAEQINSLLFSMPNILSDDVPDGLNEEDNILLRQFGIIPSFDFQPLDHVALGEINKCLNFEAAAICQAQDLLS